ncbi:hypothetical protein OMP38_05980 [Cohnella ginsengisoli]|uniref:DUF2269 family protein n=1 Tax=Cohnella ginsengisoli TaxID=425004 RepID=A0A9X4QL80_9BACL|nr:hypothetical protein [Cohnella ginsengisoli]MDG0790444.1 hypothetical protein [Cohnella ginsengisoli]
MYDVMIFLHIVGAIGMGIYALLPFLAKRFRQLSTPAQEGLASGLVAAGRIGQYSLVLQLLTGGYLISQNDYKVAWMITIVVLFLALGALSGIVQAPLKRIVAAASGGQDASSNISRVQTLSIVILVIFLVVVWLMKNPWYA